jgi:hypothetical protein
MRTPGSCIGLVIISNFAGSVAILQGIPTPDKELDLTIAVHDYSTLEPASFQRAAEVTRRIFGTAGIRLELAPCPLSPIETSEKIRCGRGPNSEGLTMNILPGTMARHLSRPPGEFGRSLATDAYIFLDRIDEVNEGDRRGRDLLLGYILAHELGHLLLGHGSHSRAGIMKAVVVPDDIVQLRQGTVTFHPAEAKRMRDHLRNGLKNGS